MKVIFTAVHWMRSWVPLQHSDEHDLVMETSLHLTHLVAEFFSWAYG
jgi:prephenate dehydrogenase